MAQYGMALIAKPDSLVQFPRIQKAEAENIFLGIILTYMYAL